jgi:hypothetical protein
MEITRKLDAGRALSFELQASPPAQEIYQPCFGLMNMIPQKKTSLLRIE